MGNFNRDNQSRGKRKFGGGKFGGGRGAGRPQMHKATCGKCGNECTIPFKPTGDRPVFCSACFESQGLSRRGEAKAGGGQSGGRGRKNFDRPRFKDRKPGFKDQRQGSDDKQMHEAVCAKCGDKCEVPFKPMEGKPVYCTKCFEKGGKNTLQFKEQFDVLNTKLDKIMIALKITAYTETAKEEKKTKKTKKSKVKIIKEEKKEKKAKKTLAKKKVVAKKAKTKKKK